MIEQPEKAGHMMALPLAVDLTLANRQIDRLREEIERLRAQRDQLLAALNLVMVGGNHLASVLIGRLGGDFSTKYPPDLDHEIALQMLGATDTYEVWCCWAAIMTARAAMEDRHD